MIQKSNARLTVVCIEHDLPDFDFDNNSNDRGEVEAALRRRLARQDNANKPTTAGSK